MLKYNHSNERVYYFIRLSLIAKQERISVSFILFRGIHPIECILKGGLLIKLFIARLPHTYTSRMLEELFSPFGDVISANMLTNGTTLLSIGCGYVEMEHLFEAQSAILKLNKSSIEGKNIGVSLAILKKIDNLKSKNI